MFTARIEVTRPVEGHDPELTYQQWDFQLLDNHLVVDRWAVWTRPTRRHKPKPQNSRLFMRGKWGRRVSDTGIIYLGPFDVPLPDDVAAEAKAKLMDHITVSVERPTR